MGSPKAPEPTAPPRRRSLLKRLAFSAAILVFVPAIAEVMLRVFYPSAPRVRDADTYEADDALGFRPRPNAHGTFFNGVDFTLNALGFRGRDPVMPKPDGVVRLLCLGDSFTFGKGIPDGHTFPDVLERRLRDRVPSRPIDVVNAGVNGYGTDQQALLLRRIGPELRPDVIVIAFFVGNDFGDNLLRDELTAYRGYLVRTSSVRGRERFWVDLYLRAKIAFQELYLVNVLRGLGAELRPIEPGSPYCRALVERQANPLAFFQPEAATSPWLESAIDATRRELRAIAEQSATLGAAVILLALPDRLQVEPELRHIVLARSGNREESLDWSRPQDVLASIAKELNVHFLDAREAFDAGPPGRYFLPCDTHFDVAGNERVGRYLAEAIVRSGVLP